MIFKALVSSYLQSNKEDEFVNIGYLVKNTLSDKGAVKRGVLHADENGNVERLVESRIERREDGEVYATPLNKESWRNIDENTLVSMNMFGFTNKLMIRLAKDTLKFFNEENLETGEFLIPEVIDKMVEDNEVTLKVLPTPSKWFGITYKEDLDELKEAVEQMKKDGIYPKHLYS